MFFSVTALYVAISLFSLSVSMSWTMPVTWLVNSTKNDPQCKNKFPSNPDFMIGLDYSYFLSAQVFFAIGMVFGQSYAANYVEPLLWVKT